MTRDDIIRMAEETGINWDLGKGPFFYFTTNGIERFAALVAAEKEQQMIRDGWRKCAEGQRTTQYCGLLDAAVKDEREACAKVCDANVYISDGMAQQCAEAIRARGEA